MKTLSIVVPVYNVENYLERCLQSLIVDNKSFLEVILVDDGSTDSSSEICDRYAEKYENISVIHKENGGLSDARNAGLFVSHGDYVWFVDSDDSISSGILDEFKNLVESNEPDIIVTNYVMHIGEIIQKREHKVLEEDKNYNNNEYLKKVLLAHEYYLPVWVNFYKKSFLVDNGFKFIKGIYHEDEQLNPYMFLAASEIMYINKFSYNYYVRNNSIMTGGKYKKNISDSMLIFNENRIYFENNITDIDLKKLLLNDIVEKIVYFSCRFVMGKVERKKFIDKHFLFKNALGVKNKIRVMLFICCYNLYKWLFDKNEKRKLGENE